MNIGFLTSEYPHKNTGASGGIGTSIKNLAFALTNMGHNITVFVFGQSVDNEFSDNGVLIVQIENVILKGLSWYFTRKKIQKVINNHIENRYLQCIESPDWTGITAFMHLKCPVVIKLHGSDTYFCHLDNRPVKKWNYILEKRALKEADAHISVSSYTARLTNEVFSLNLNFKIINNGIELDRYDYKKNHNSDSEHNQIILYAGTLIRKKGVLELPYIFNEVHKINEDAELILVGSDSGDIKTGNSSTWELMKPLFTSEAFSKVKFEGKKPHDEMKGYYSAASVCVFPSFAEAFPISWLEAMAMGKPIVASDIGWSGEVIEDGFSGIMCNPRDHQVFASHIIRILDNKELSSKLGKNARERVLQNFTAEIIASKNLDFYRSLI